MCGQWGVLCQVSFSTLITYLCYPDTKPSSHGQPVMLWHWVHKPINVFCWSKLSTQFWNKHIYFYVKFSPSVALNIDIIITDLKSTCRWKLATKCLCFTSTSFPAPLAGIGMLLPPARCLGSWAFYRYGWSTIRAKCGKITLHEISAGEKWYLNISKTCAFFLEIVRN